MSNESFQIIITAAVVLAFLAMIVQGLTVLAFYRSGRELATRLAPVLARARSILAVEKDSIRRLEVVIDKTLLCADILERVAPRLATLAARTEALAARTMLLGSPFKELERSVQLVETATHFTWLEMRPRLAAIAAETSALVRSAGAQIRRVHRILNDAIGHFSHLREVIASR